MWPLAPLKIYHDTQAAEKRREQAPKNTYINVNGKERLVTGLTQSGQPMYVGAGGFSEVYKGSNQPYMKGEAKELPQMEEGIDLGEGLNQSNNTEDMVSIAKQLADLQFQYTPKALELIAGLSEQYLPRYLSLYDQLRSSDLQNIMRTATQMQPQLDALQRLAEGADLSKMRDLASSQVLAELEAGQQLSPEMLRNVQQGLRSGEMARGIATGGASANREAVQQTLAGRELWKDRLGLSQQLRNFEKGMRYDPWATVATTPTNIPLAQSSFATGIDFGQRAITGGISGAQQQQSLQNQMQQFRDQMALQRAQYLNSMNLAQQLLPQYMA